jgi:hypothetical protein
MASRTLACLARMWPLNPRSITSGIGSSETVRVHGRSPRLHASSDRCISRITKGHFVRRSKRTQFLPIVNELWQGTHPATAVESFLHVCTGALNQAANCTVVDFNTTSQLSVPDQHAISNVARSDVRRVVSRITKSGFASTSSQAGARSPACSDG